MCVLKALRSTVCRVSKGFKMSQVSSARPFLLRTWEFSPRHLCRQPERRGFSNHNMVNSVQFTSATYVFILLPTSWFQNVLRRRPQGLACGQVCLADPKMRLGDIRSSACHWHSYALVNHECTLRATWTNLGNWWKLNQIEWTWLLADKTFIGLASNKRISSWRGWCMLQIRSRPPCIAEQWTWRGQVNQRIWNLVELWWTLVNLGEIMWVIKDLRPCGVQQCSTCATCWVLNPVPPVPWLPGSSASLARTWPSIKAQLASSPVVGSSEWDVVRHGQVLRKTHHSN